ncbi:AAA family ATPase [Pseudomonas congelans]|nr:ATP-binding protein [Pseudomonas congelans]
MLLEVKMLLRFGTSNHLSVREYQELSLVATPLKGSLEGLLQSSDTADQSKAFSTVPVVAIYGANAAGKSTILRALEFFVTAIKESQNGSSSRQGTPYQPFLLDENSRNSVSRYDADFVIDGIRYHYGFTLDGKIVHSEWLFSFPAGSQRQVRSILFHRDAADESSFYFGKSLKGDNKRISKLTRNNSLFLSSAAQNAHSQLSKIYDYFSIGFSQRLETVSDNASISEQMFAYFGADKAQRKRAMNFMQAADIGIADVEFSKKAPGKKTQLLIQEFENIFTKHFSDFSFPESYETNEAKILHYGEYAKYYPIALEYESSGTKALLQILGPVFTKLENGGTLIVDELNIALHPLVSHELIKLFSSPETNPGRAQLIFTTHDTNILTSGLLRRDQIWFVEKDGTGSTCLYPLSSIKIRQNDNFEKGYIEGRFGAIPMFGLNKYNYKNLDSLSKEGDK